MSYLNKPAPKDSKSLNQGIKSDQITSFFPKITKAKSNWWVPIWRGLVADPNAKHRKAMNTGIWLYIYLLFHVNPATGIVKRSFETIAEETGYPLRTIHSDIARLKKRGYIKSVPAKKPLAIQIEKKKTLKKAFSVKKPP